MTIPLHLAPSTKIVVVEDDENDSFILLRDLKKLQLMGDVTVISNGYRAYNHLLETSQPPSILFLDLGLPGIGGLELLRKIRGVKRLQSLPVIVMTGSLNPRDRTECAKYHVTAFLSKPVSMTDFISSVAHLFPERSLATP